MRATFVDVFSSALRGEECHVLGFSAAPHRLPVTTWNRSADPGDAAVLDQCVGPTLDIGCGPGRMTQFLAERGQPVLGIDVVPEAVAQTRERGGPAILRDVFSPLPGEGRWETALLADGNIGIGGDPPVLLRRVAALIRPGGRVVVDLDEPGSGVRTWSLLLETRSHRTEAFPWAVVGLESISAVAESAGLAVVSLHDRADRWFAVLRTAC